MKKKNPIDKLENFFRNYFNDSEKVNQADGWNVPSEGVWDNIEKGLAKGKKPEKKFLYWQLVAAAASVLLLLSLFQVYQSNLQIESLSKKIVINNQAVQNIKADLQALNKERAQERKSVILFTEESNNANRKISSLKKINKNNPKQVTAFNPDIISNLLDFKFVVSTSSDDKLEEVTFVGDTTLLPLNEKISNNQNKDLNVFPLQKVKSINNNILLELLPSLTNQLDIATRNINSFNLPISPVLKKRPRIYLAASYSPVQTTIKSKDLQSNRNDFFPKREFQETAFSTGLQFGVKLKKGWSVETGLRYSSTEKSIQHNRVIPYQILQEGLNGNGNYESIVKLQLGSSDGEVDTNISLSRSSSSTIASDTKINMDINYASKRSYLDLPLLVKKEWASGSLAFSLKTGLLNRFLLNRSFELQRITIDDIRFNSKTNVFRERPNSKSNSSYSAHYLAGIGLEYTFRSDLAFYIEPTFIRSIQPTNDSKEASIYTQSKVLNIGFRYML